MFIDELKAATNYKLTENGGVSRKSTLNDVYDMFAFGGAYRTRSDADCILLFKNAFEQDPTLAMKCLFYLADCRGGQGERRFFRVCFHWLAECYPEVAKLNIPNIPIYRRWDDVLYSTINTPIWEDAMAFIKSQLVLDMQCKTPSLLAKWLPSENASSNETRAMGGAVRVYLNMTHKEYRKTLSELRSRINILEKLMSENRWDEIEFDKIPSRAGLIYKNAFAKHDINKRYEEFAADKSTKVNAGVLYPYEVVAKATESMNWRGLCNLSETDRLMLEKYWDNLPDYFGGKESNILCVVDTSGSMTGSQASAPINVAISLGMYCAERAGGPFKDHYISFSRYPQLIRVQGVDFVNKVARIYETNLCENTDLTKVFDLLLDIASSSREAARSLPETICVISDMEIDHMSYWDNKDEVATEMERMRLKWQRHGLKMPKLIYWNVEARSNNILDQNENVSYVSGMSPTLFESVLTGKTGWDLCLEKLLSDRYVDVVA